MADRDAVLREVSALVTAALWHPCFIRATGPVLDRLDLDVDDNAEVIEKALRAALGLPADGTTEAATAAGKDNGSAQ